MYVGMHIYTLRDRCSLCCHERRVFPHGADDATMHGAAAKLLQVIRTNRLPRIDLMSVDAEGSELEIFKDFPFQLPGLKKDRLVKSLT